MGRFKDITGQTFGRVSVLSRADDRIYSNGRRKVYWNCLCTCGTEFITAGDYLKQGDTKSCGCIITERRGSITSKGLEKEYNSWRGMKDRCYNEKHEAFKNYGGKGVTVCEQWLGEEGFSKFLEDMGRKPDPEYTLDREDYEGNYSPENCRWASKQVQAWNRGIQENNTTSKTGVSELRGKYQSCISKGGVVEYLGYFDTLRQATEARERAEIRLYGEIKGH